MYFVWLGYILLQFVLSTLATISKEWWVVGYTSEESAYSMNLPRWLGSHGNFDGLHYMAISKDAYEMYRHAFFPLYPSLIHLLAPITPGGRYFAGLMISLMCLGVIVFVWNRIYLVLDGKKNPQTVSPALWLLLASPCAFFFTTLYTESLFLALLGGYTWSLIYKKHRLAIMFGFFLGLTRLAGVFVTIIPLTLFAQQYLKGAREMLIQSIKSATTPVLGLGCYMLYLWYTTGNAFEFISAQRGFGNSRSTSLILLPQVLYRYAKILTQSAFDLGYLVALVELGIFVSFVGVLLYHLYGLVPQTQKLREQMRALSHTEVVTLGLVLFSLLNLIIPTLTGTLSSMPRYALASVAVPLLLHRYLGKQQLMVSLVICVIIQVVFALAFYSGHFVS